MLDRELIFCCCAVLWPLAVARLMGVRSQVQLNVIYAATGVRERREGGRNQNGNYKIFPHQRNALIAFN